MLNAASTCFQASSAVPYEQIARKLQRAKRVCKNKVDRMMLQSATKNTYTEAETALLVRWGLSIQRWKIPGQNMWNEISMQMSCSAVAAYGRFLKLKTAETELVQKIKKEIAAETEARKLGRGDLSKREQQQLLRRRRRKRRVLDNNSDEDEDKDYKVAAAAAAAATAERRQRYTAAKEELIVRSMLRHSMQWQTTTSALWKELGAKLGVKPITVKVYFEQKLLSKPDHYKALVARIQQELDAVMSRGGGVMPPNSEEISIEPRRKAFVWNPALVRLIDRLIF